MESTKQRKNVKKKIFSHVLMSNENVKEKKIYIQIDGAWSRSISRLRRDKKPKSNDDFYYY